MATERHPHSGKQVPDPATSYGREKPEAESGMGRLDNNKAVPTNRPDKMHQAVKNSQPPRQINAEDESQSGAASRARTPNPGEMPPPEPVDHSMKDEEPLGWDQAPMDIKRARDQRQPRTGGKGGTPDADDPRKAG